jgi:hypothetical protein
MKRVSNLLPIGVLGAACLVNAFFFLPNSWKALTAFRAVQGRSNPERRFLQKGDWYRVILSLENQVPRNASIRLVSPAPPWYLAYYLYPRLLKRGSEALADADAVRKRHPGDWVLVYAESPPQMKILPPLTPGVPDA